METNKGEGNQKIEAAAGDGRGTNSRFVLISLVLSLAIFAVDILAPRGTLSALLYIFPLLLFMQSGRKERYSLFPLYLTILTVIAAFFKPAAGIAVEIAVINRAETVFIIWAMTYLAWRRNTADELVYRRASEYRILAEYSPDIVIQLDRDLRYVYLNPEALKQVGKPKEAYLGKTLRETVADDTQYAFWKGHVERVFTTGKSMEVEYTLSYHNEKKIFSGKIVPVPGLGGGVAYVIVVSRDITERKRAEEALRESESLLDAFFSNTPMAMIIYSDDNRYVRINKYAANLYGEPVSEVLGKSIFELLPPDLAQVTAQRNREVIETKRPSLTGVYSARLPLRSREGKTTYWRGVRFSVPLPEGKTGVGVVTIDITESIQAEKALRESEERFHTLADNMSQFSWMADANGWIFWYNKRWYDYTGTNLEEMQGWGWQKVHHPDYLKGVAERFRHSVEAGETWEDTFPLRGKDGEYRWFLSRAVPIRDKEGKVIRWFGTNTDITQLRETQQLLTDAEKKAKKRAQEAEEGQRTLTALMDNIPEGIFIAESADVRIRLVSRYMAEITGTPQKEFQGLKYDEVRTKISMQEILLTPAAKHLPLVRAVKYGEVVTDDEWMINPPGRDPVTVLINARPIRNSRGAITGGVSSWRDITERKRAENILRRSEYELRTLVDNSPDLIFRMDRQLKYAYANPAYERLTGILKEKLIGKTNSDLGMPPPLIEFWRTTMQGVLESGRDHSVEFDMTSLFGKRYFSARLIPEFGKSGLVETVLVIARDITERKRAEEKIRYISFHDEVTGLFNRAFFEEEIHRVDTERELPISIIMGDVNNLKLSNDVFGHEEGDTLLKTLADSIRKACRKNDIIARWGGDEFAVILPGTDHATAQNVICARIKQIAKENKETVIAPSIALGAATKESRNQNVYQVIRQAEERMYQNKLDESKQNEDIVFACLFERARERTRDLDAHINRNYALADKFGNELDLSESQMDDLRLLVKLHDIGDAVIPREILMKPEPLNQQEWEIMKKHAEAGFRIVKTFADTSRISDEVLSHGERWDGAGYPRGLKEKEIPYLARIFFIIDAFDVMTHPRPYARTFTQEKAIDEMHRNAGKQFDPELVDRFITVMSEKVAVKGNGA